MTGVVTGQLWESEGASDPRDQVDGYDDGRGSSWWDGFLRQRRLDKAS